MSFGYRRRPIRYWVVQEFRLFGWNTAQVQTGADTCGDRRFDNEDQAIDYGQTYCVGLWRTKKVR
jgi:hypothetical protein